MKHYLFFLLIALVVFTSCSFEKEKQVVKENSTENVIPFEYGGEKTKHIVFNSLINDSIPVKILFDTGSPDARILVADTLRNKLDTAAYLRIGNLEKLVNLWFFDNDYMAFKHFGLNTILVGWYFFENEIIEISYHNKYLKILPELPELLDDYKCVKIIVNNRGFLSVPIIAYLQGKQIKKGVIIDTGSDGGICLSYSDAIRARLNTDSAIIRTMHATANDSCKIYSLKSDSIAILSNTNPETIAYAIANENRIGFFDTENVGMLGNLILENFELILDLKNYNLYLKPVEKSRADF